MSLSSILESVTGPSPEGQRYECLLGMIADERLSKFPSANAEAKRPAVMLAIDYSFQQAGCATMAERVAMADETLQAETKQQCASGRPIALEV